MKKRMAIITGIVAALTLAAVPLVYAQHGRGMRAHHGGGMFGGMEFLSHLRQVAEELDLSGEQKDQIHTIMREAHEQNAQYRDQMHGRLMEVAQILVRNPNDLASAQALLDQQTATEKTMKSNMLVATSKALNVLTAEQRAKLSGIMSERAARRESRRR